MSAERRSGAGGAGGGGDVVVHLAPHADDECIGAPATLMALRDAGWRVVNVTCSLGRPEQADRRRAEVTEACRRAAFDSLVLDDPLHDPLEGGDVGPSGRRLEAQLAPVLDRLAPRIVLSPSPHDRHRGHEVVGRAALALGARGADAGGAVDGARLWLWGLWADLPLPTLALGFGPARLEEILGALAAHGGELDRNDYRRLVRGRAEMNAVLGPERVFGFGSAGVDAGAEDAAYVELLCEIGRTGGSWRLGRPRWLDPAAPVGPLGATSADPWLEAPSVTDRFGPPG